MHGFDNLRHELDAKRQQLEQELQTAQGKVAELEADLERVHQALDALLGPKRRAKGRSRSGKKPAVSVAAVQAHIVRVRAEKPYASAHELQKAVRALVRESGESLTGFPRVFAEALVSSPGFSGSSANPATLVAARTAVASHAEKTSHEAPHSPVSESIEEPDEENEDESEEEDTDSDSSDDEGPFTNLL